MRPARERAVQGTAAVLVDIGGLVGDLRREIGFVLPRLESARGEKGRRLLQHAEVAGG